MANNKIEEIYEREQEEATEINKRADELKKENPNLNWTDASQEVIDKIDNERKNRDYKGYLADSEASSRAKSLFYSKDWQNKSRYKSDDLLNVMEHVRTTTGAFQEGHSLSKILTVSELGDYVEEKGLGSKTAYYLAANRDYQLPLALRFRNIKMLDACYNHEFKQQLFEELKKFGGFKIIIDDNDFTEINFNFDFGRGKKEPVNISFVTKNIYEMEEPQEDVGAVLSFFTGPGSAPAFMQKLYPKIADGGIIFDDNTSPIYSLAVEKTAEEMPEGKDIHDIEYEQRIALFKKKEIEIAEGFGFEVKDIPGTPYQAFIKKQYSQKWLDFLKKPKENKSRPLNIPPPPNHS